ncbi:thymopoietin isoform X2 [Pleurodeles waltl]|uniref:thymopoietin isoform X2 n=1 Tax=Pleurodeles waltl TaxID=8319 RepID=UPI0037096ADE
MPEFLEDPSVLTKDKLKSELLANSVALPAGDQRKDVYVQLYRQHLTVRNKGKSRDFSSDEEREATPARSRPRKATKKTDKQRPEEKDDFDVTGLSNEDLKEELIKYGLKPGPIMGSTRKVYEKKLLKLKEDSDVPPAPHAVSSTAEESKQNGNTDSDQYSDDDDPEIILKLEKREPLKGRPKAQVNLRQIRVEQNQTTEDMIEIPEQCLKWINRPPIKAFSSEDDDLNRTNSTFSEEAVTETSWTSGSTKIGPLQTVARETAPVSRRTSRKRVEAAEQPFDEAIISGSIPITETLRSSSNQTVAHSEFEKYESRQVGNKVIGNFQQGASLLSASDFSELPRRTPKKTLTTEVLEKTATEERWSNKDILKEMFPYEASTPTGISVSCRRPIKGAAGRPVQLSEYKMEESYSAKYVPKYTALVDSKPQPTTKGRSLPVWIKILLFVLVAVFLFLVYQAMETNEGNPFAKYLL